MSRDVAIKTSNAEFRRVCKRYFKGESIASIAKCTGIPATILIAWRDQFNWAEARIEQGLGNLEAASELMGLGTCQLGRRQDRIAAELEYLLERRIGALLERGEEMTAPALSNVVKAFRLLQDARRLIHGQDISA